MSSSCSVPPATVGASNGPGKPGELSWVRPKKDSAPGPENVKTLVSTALPLNCSLIKTCAPPGKAITEAKTTAETGKQSRYKPKGILSFIGLTALL